MNINLQTKIPSELSAQFQAIRLEHSPAVGPGRQANYAHQEARLTQIRGALTSRKLLISGLPPLEFSLEKSSIDEDVMNICRRLDIQPKQSKYIARAITQLALADYKFGNHSWTEDSLYWSENSLITAITGRVQELILLGQLCSRAVRFSALAETFPFYAPELISTNVISRSSIKGDSTPTQFVSYANIIHPNVSDLIKFDQSITYLTKTFSGAHGIGPTEIKYAIRLRKDPATVLEQTATNLAHFHPQLIARARKMCFLASLSKNFKLDDLANIELTIQNFINIKNPLSLTPHDKSGQSFHRQVADNSASGANPEDIVIGTEAQDAQRRKILSLMQDANPDNEVHEVENAMLYYFGEYVPRTKEETELLETILSNVIA